MDEASRRSSTYRKLQVILLLAGILTISGCTLPKSAPGGARVHIDSICGGLEELGYSEPFSMQDANDIDALGYSECAEYIRYTLGN